MVPEFIGHPVERIVAGTAETRSAGGVDHD